MARGVGKTIVAAAKLLSNPVAAVASVFRKKKGLKRGPTAASAGMVRRHYKGRRSAGPVLKNDGQGNVQYSKSIGRIPPRLGRVMESKIRDMLNPANHHIIQHSDVVSTTMGKSTYQAFEMFNATDIDEVIFNASGQTGTQIKWNGKLNISNAKLVVQLRNQTTNLLTLRVYEYICRRDVPDKIQADPTAAPEVDGTTQNALIYGFNYQQTPLIQGTSVGGTLFQNTLFCTYYKITKVRNIQLGAGKCFNMSMSVNKSRTINPLVYNATDGDVLAGMTRGFVVQAVGSMVGPAGHGQPTTGIVNFDYLITRKYAYNQPWSGTAKNTITSDVPQELVSAQYLNEFSGIAQSQQEA